MDFGAANLCDNRDGQRLFLGLARNDSLIEARIIVVRAR